MDSETEDLQDEEFITVKEEFDSDNEDYENHAHIIVEDVDVEEERYNEKIDKEEVEEKPCLPRENDFDPSTSKRTDVFQQPFVMDYLQKYVLAKDPVIDKSLKMENEFETFVNPRCVCRLCTKTDQTIYMRLFYSNQTMTPIANKIVYLMGKEKVEQDLLPQQICIGCSELVDSSYSALTRFSESYQILSDVVAQFRKKTHVYQSKKFDNGLYLALSDKEYTFGSKSATTSSDLEERSTEDTKSSKNVKCYLCMKNFSSGDLKAHMSEVHDCNIEYKCAHCEDSFPTLTDLSSHMVLCNSSAKEHDDDSGEENERDCVYVDDISLPTEPDYTPLRRKKTIVLEEYRKVLKIGAVPTTSCVHCPRLFKSNTKDDLLKSHALMHLFAIKGEEKSTIDVETLNVSDHFETISCYVCTMCKMPKRSPEEMKTHLSHFCTTFATKCNFKIRDRKRYGRMRKPYYCKVCADGKAYKFKEMKHHNWENHPHLLFNCRHCSCFFLERYALQYHINKYHVGQKPKEENGENIKIEDTKNKLSDTTPFLCEYCSKECKSKKGYRLHIIKLHLNPSKMSSKRKSKIKTGKKSSGPLLHCHICDKKFNFSEGQPALDFHIMKHTTENNKVSCCNREYDCYSKYRKHIQSHSRTWYCKLCGESCASMVLLHDHLTQNHIRCEECGFAGKTNAELMKHREQAHGDNVVCTVCNIMFSTKKELLVHRRQYHWEQLIKDNAKSDLPEPVLCCGTKFVKRENLKRHTSKHQDTICKTCGDILKSKLALISHNTVHHRRRVECSFCNKFFTSADTLKYHMLRHTQGRQFKCPCGLSFFTEADKNKHQRTRKKPCLGKMVGQQGVDTVVVGEEDMEWTEEVEED